MLSRGKWTWGLEKSTGEEICTWAAKRRVTRKERDLCGTEPLLASPSSNGPFINNNRNYHLTYMCGQQLSTVKSETQEECYGVGVSQPAHVFPVLNAGEKHTERRVRKRLPIDHLQMYCISIPVVELCLDCVHSCLIEIYNSFAPFDQQVNNGHPCQ